MTSLPLHHITERRGGTRVKPFVTSGPRGFPDARTFVRGGGGSGAVSTTQHGPPSASKHRNPSSHNNPKHRSPSSPQKLPDNDDQVTLKDVKDMTEQERNDALREITSTFKPETLSRLVAKRQSHKSVVIVSQTPTPASKYQHGISTLQQLEEAVKTLPSREQDKLRWLKDEEEEDTNSLIPPSPRYDLAGVLIIQDNVNNTTTYQPQLHHHGLEPNRAGYTFDEMFLLARSSMSQQRGVMLRALAGALRHRASNITSSSPLPPFALKSLRTALDAREDPTSLFAAIDALHAFCISPMEFQSRQQASDLCGFGAYEWGVVNRAQGSSRGRKAREFVGQDKDEEEFREMDDDDLYDASPARALVRTIFLARAYTLLNVTLVKVPIPDSTQAQLVDIITYIARVCPIAVANEPNLVASLVARLSGDGNATPPSGVMCISILRLITVLCCTNKNMAVELHPVLQTCRRFLAPGGHDDDVDVHCATLRLWRVMVEYELEPIEYLSTLLPGMFRELLSRGQDVNNTRVAGHVFALLESYLRVRRTGSSSSSSSVEIWQTLMLETVVHEAVAWAATRFSASPITSASAVRFLGEYIALFHNNNNNNTAKLEDELTSLIITPLPSLTPSQVTDNEDRLSTIFNAIAIFGGFATWMQDDDQYSAHVKSECVDATLSALYTSSLVMPPSTFSSPLLDDLWEICSKQQQQRTSQHIPLHPCDGASTWFLSKSFISMLRLRARLVGMFEPCEHETLCRDLVHHVAFRSCLGPMGDEATVRVIIRVLLQAVVGVAEVETVLLPVFDTFLWGQQQEPMYDCRTLCARDTTMTVWRRAGLAWPALPLFSGAADVGPTVATAALRFLAGLGESVGVVGIVSSLLGFARGVSLDTLLDSDAGHLAVELWDWAMNNKAVTVVATTKELVDALGGKEEMRQLGIDIATAHDQRCFNHGLLTRCASLLFQRDMPVVVRAATWRVFAQSNTLSRFTYVPLPLGSFNRGLDDDDVEKVMPALFVDALVRGDVMGGTTLFEFIVGELLVFFTTPSLETGQVKLTWPRERMLKRLIEGAVEPSLIKRLVGEGGKALLDELVV